MKLWEKNDTALNKSVETFTVGKDKQWDLLLAEYDVKGSLAHVKMLQSVNLISENELTLLTTELEKILEEIHAGKFSIDEGIEDVHSQIESILTEKLGETGKKIHTGRSRNDQVLLDIKLFCKEELEQTVACTKKLFDVLIELSEKHKDVLLPGYSHLQLAMPSSFGLWFGAYAESLTDDLEMVRSAYRITNRNPLGSAAGYGTSLPLNRQMTTELLGFESMNYNSVYAQMTRGKTEKVIAMALSCVAGTLSKFAMDACLYLSQNFNFISFPDNLTTGSSIMPHKKNPDVFELIRAKCNRLQALPNEITLLLSNLPSGYHRDLQLTKDCLFPAFAEIQECLNMATLMLCNIQVRTNILEDKMYANLFSVEVLNDLVLKGVSFREAYKQVGNEIGKNGKSSNRKLNHTHEGSMGKLCNQQITERFAQIAGDIK